MSNIKDIDEKIQIRKGFATTSDIAIQLTREEFLKLSPEDQRKYLDQQYTEYEKNGDKMEIHGIDVVDGVIVMDDPEDWE